MSMKSRADVLKGVKDFLSKLPSNLSSASVDPKFAIPIVEDLIPSDQVYGIRMIAGQGKRAEAMWCVLEDRIARLSMSAVTVEKGRSTVLRMNTEVYPIHRMVSAKASFDYTGSLIRASASLEFEGQRPIKLTSTKELTAESIREFMAAVYRAKNGRRAN